MLMSRPVPPRLRRHWEWPGRLCHSPSLFSELAMASRSWLPSVCVWRLLSSSLSFNFLLSASTFSSSTEATGGRGVSLIGFQLGRTRV